MFFDKRHSWTKKSYADNLDWPENYFAELLPEKRRAILDAQAAIETETDACAQAAAEKQAASDTAHNSHGKTTSENDMTSPAQSENATASPAQSENDLISPAQDEDDSFSLGNIRRLFDFRYKMNKKGAYADGFMRTLVEIRMVGDSLGSLFMKKRNLKIVKNSLKNLCLTEESTFPADLMYRELCQLISLYICACLDDKNYNAILLGVGRVSDERTQQKIEADLLRLGETIPEYFGLEDEFKPFRLAIREVKQKFF